MDEKEARIARLKRLKRKRILTVAVLFVLLIGLGCGYLVAKQYERDRTTKAAEEEEAQKEKSVEITSFTYYEVQEIEYTNETDSFHFARNEDSTDGAWKRVGQEAFLVDSEKLMDVICCLCKVSSTTKVETDTVDLAAYGVENAPITVKITLKDGSVHAFRLGNDAPYDAGCYLYYETTGELWVVQSYVRTYFAKSATKLVAAEEFPETSEENITKVTVAVRGEDSNSYLPQMAEDGAMVYPAVFSACEKFVASTIQEYDCKDFAAYGLEEPYVIVTVNYMESITDADGKETKSEKVMTLEIGDLTVSNNYYVRINQSPYVYIMTAAFAEKYIPQ